MTLVSLPSPELLAPAGDADCARAAIQFGADAIYFGLDIGFNARARATNFHLDELPELMQTLHRNRVKGFVTLNTLVFTDELPVLETNVRKLADAGVDAVIVQDIGAVKLIRRIAPTLAIHGSTQMTVTSAEGLKALRNLSLQRIVLARELSIQEIQKITKHSDTPVEVFIHGALCVAYSGQCLTSESLGGRSANRGQCAQACRLTYDLICDGKPMDLAQNKYLLSPLDLAAYDHVPQLIAAGVSSFKIEGRLKSPEYVANIVSHYRQAIDSAMADRFQSLPPHEKFEMELSFSRGFSPGWLEGCNHKRLVPGLSSSKRGVEVGTVRRVHGETIIADLIQPLGKGDGIVIEGDRAAGQEIGGRIYGIARDRQSLQPPAAGQVEIRLQHGVVPHNGELAGRKIYLTHSPALSKKWQLRHRDATNEAKTPIEILIQASVDELLQIEVRVGTATFTLHSEHVLQTARQHPASLAVLQQQFSRLGNTPFRLQELSATIVGGPMIPLSVLGELRAKMVTELERSVDFQNVHRVTADIDVATKLIADANIPISSERDMPLDSAVKLHVLCRSLAQLQALVDLGVQHFYAEFHDIRQYAHAVEIARQAGCEIILAPLRIQKPGEIGLLRALLKRNADGWLVRNLATLNFAREQPFVKIGDFSLNITNPIAAKWYLDQGLHRVTASYDLNRDQLLDLVQYLPAERLEIVIHQHMPMFHMEHCVFCTVLSPGTNKSNCGRPCDRHVVHLKDRVGTEHFLDADIGCRNTLYNGRPQSGAEAVPALIMRGVRHFRVEVLPTATVAELQHIIPLYQSLLQGKLDGSEVWKYLRADNRIGVTRGTMEQKRNPLAIL